MLDKSKLIAQLYKVADQLFLDYNPGQTVARDVWQAICKDPLFIYKVRSVVNPPWPVPLWEGDLGVIMPIELGLPAYMVLSVDGSQIYPDRHAFLSCFLINTGSVVLPYGIPDSRVELLSEPTIFAGLDDDGVPFTTDTVNCKRQELELDQGLNLAKRMVAGKELNTSLVILFDGSLIFWHLSSKDIQVRDKFLHAYIAILDQMYQEKIITAWYISLPKSKELVNLVRLFLCNFDVSQEHAYASIDKIIDTTILSHFLPPLSRTILFKNQSSITAQYPPQVHPHFFYINTGKEIARVEVPYWMTQDTTLIDQIAAQIISQCHIGDGYPVTIAEAHEQAVVKGPDREFFYYMLDKLSLERNYHAISSVKSVRKTRMGF